MANQLMEDGAVVVTSNGDQLVCTAVRYQETPEGEKHSFEYSFRSQADLDAEREAREKAESEAAQAEAPVEESTNDDGGEQ